MSEPTDEAIIRAFRECGGSAAEGVHCIVNLITFARRLLAEQVERDALILDEESKMYWEAGSTAGMSALRNAAHKIRAQKGTAR